MTATRISDWEVLVERFSPRTASMNAILADSEGWRKWCEENPEKCEYVPKAKRLAPMKSKKTEGTPKAVVSQDLTLAGLPAKTAAAVTARFNTSLSVTPEQAGENMDAIFDEAIENPEMAAYATWYNDAHEFAGFAASTEGRDYDPDVAASVVAALSPGGEWGENQRQADIVLDSIFRNETLDPAHANELLSKENERGEVASDFRLDGPMTLRELAAIDPRAAGIVIAREPRGDNGTGFPLRTYDNVTKAVILANANDPKMIDETLTGAKVRSFFNNISEPDSVAGDVTIDKHMQRALAVGALRDEAVIAERVNRIEKDQTALTGSPAWRNSGLGAYPLMADVVRAATARANERHGLSLTPNQFQAVVWGWQTKTYRPERMRAITNKAKRSSAWCDDCQGPIMADTQGWRDWCEANPEKCGGGLKTKGSARGVDTIKKALLRDGGFTINPRTGVLVTTGYSVGIAGHSSITAASDFMEGDNAQRAIDDWLEREGSTFGADESLNFGGWYDRDNDEIVLDPSKNVADEAEAVQLGRDWDQQSIWDHKNNREIPTGGTGGRVASCEECHAPITADTEGWRRWCEANPEKCGGGASEPEMPPTEGPTKIIGDEFIGQEIDEAKYQALHSALREGADIPEAHYSTTGDATYEAFDFTDAKRGPLGPEGKVRIADYKRGQFGMGQQKDLASVRPPSHVFRAVSEADYARIREAGELSSDTRGAISSEEGMNAAMDPESAFSYLPRGGVDGSKTGVIMRIKFDEGDGWFGIKADGYPRTRQAIPLSKVDTITRPIEHREDERGNDYPWMAAACDDCHAPILADTAGWRKWCEENPEKCGGEAKVEKKIEGEQELFDPEPFTHPGPSLDDVLNPPEFVAWQKEQEEIADEVAEMEAEEAAEAAEDAARAADPIMGDENPDDPDFVPKAGALPSWTPDLAVEFMRDEPLYFDDEGVDHQAEDLRASQEQRDGWISEMSPEEQAQLSEQVSQYLSVGRVVTRVQGETLQEILNDGRWETQFDTGTTGGSYNPELRRQVEGVYMGVGMEASDGRPVYGSWVTPDTRTELTEQYGNVEVILKRDVESRSTVTLLDSLGTEAFAQPLSVMRNGSLRQQALADRPSPIVLQEIFDGDTPSEYTEIQIHGGLKTPWIEHVVFRESTHQDGHDFDQTTSMLDDHGIPWSIIPDYEQDFTNEYPVEWEVRSEAKAAGLRRGRDRRSAVECDDPDHHQRKAAEVGFVRGAHERRRAASPGSCDDCHQPITADSAGWRKWCEENPEKCGGGPKRVRPPEVLEQARLLADEAKAIEPAVTAMMEALAARHGGTLVGLEHRLKEESGLARKIEDDMTAKGLSAADAAKEVSDSVRYTVTFDPDRYAGSTEATLAEVRATGFGVRVKNFWVPGDPYNGINVKMQDPTTGREIELQFHTAESLVAKDETHTIFKPYRELPPGDPARPAMWDRMVAIADAQQFPPGVERIGPLLTQSPGS